MGITVTETGVLENTTAQYQNGKNLQVMEVTFDTGTGKEYIRYCVKNPIVLQGKKP